MAEQYKAVNVPPNLERDSDFFYYNPELRFYPAIDKLVSDVGPQLASTVLWAIYLAEDPSSKFYTERPEKRREYVENVFLKTSDFDWDAYKYVIEFYPEIVMSQAMRDYYRLRRKYEAMLNEVEGLSIKEAVPFYKSLSMIYEGLDRAEGKMLKEKLSGNKGKNAPGKGAE